MDTLSVGIINDRAKETGVGGCIKKSVLIVVETITVRSPLGFICCFRSSSSDYFKCLFTAEFSIFITNRICDKPLKTESGRRVRCVAVPGGGGGGGGARPSPIN